MVDKAHIKKAIKDTMPFTVSFYHRASNVLRRLSLLLPLKTRSQMGKRLTLKDKKEIMQKIYLQRKEMPLFSGKRVLCWEPAPWPVHVALTSSIGAALSLRGCYVEQVICDGTPVACIGREIVNEESFSVWKQRCPACHRACRNEAESFGIRAVDIGELIDAKTLSELRRISQTIDADTLRSYRYRGVDVGAYAVSSLIRYYQGQVVEPEESLLREYLFSALVITDAAINKIGSFKPDAVCMTIGTYSSWGPALIVAMRKAIPIIKFSGGYRNQHTYFRKIVDNTTNFHFGVLSDRGWQKRLEQPLSSSEEQILENYTKDRYRLNPNGFCDASRMLPPTGDEQRTLEKLNITNDKPVWCVFAHLNWDNAVVLSPMAFGDFDEWIIETLRTIIDIPDVQWLIKIHPAEAMFNAIDGVGKLIQVNFPDLPSHIKVISPDTDINPYNLFNAIAGGVTCLGTVGLELAVMGKPVILAGESYYSKKGFTYDGLSPLEYKKLLRKAPEIPHIITTEQKEKARRFAYSYFIQRQIPLRMFKVGPNGRPVAFDWGKVESLLPGRDPVVDMICERFFVGADFILPDNIVHSMYDYAVEPEVVP